MPAGDGIIALPRARAAEIVSAAAVAVGTQSQLRTAILSGMDPQEAYLRFGRFCERPIRHCERSEGRNP